MRKIQKGIKKHVVVRGIDAHEWTSPSNSERSVTEETEDNEQHTTEEAFRVYTAVLQCKDSDTKISTDTTDASWKKVECVKNPYYYCKFIFGNSGDNGTDKLEEGFVDLFIYDSNKELVYVKRNYAKVFDTPIVQ